MDPSRPHDDGTVWYDSDLSSITSASSSSEDDDCTDSLASPTLPSDARWQVSPLSNVQNIPENRPPTDAALATVRQKDDVKMSTVNVTTGSDLASAINERQDEDNPLARETNSMLPRDEGQPLQEEKPREEATIALQSLLFKACMSGDLAEAAKALDLGADPNSDVLVIQGQGRRAGRHVHVPNLILSAMVAAGDIQLTALLISRGADPSRSDPHGSTALHVLATSAHYPDTTGKLTQLLAAAGADWNAQDSRGRTPLHLAAASGNSAAVDSLIRLGGVKFERDERGETPLHAAVRAGSEQTVAMLMDYKPSSVNEPNDAGETALQKAPTPEVAGLLLATGARLDSTTIAGLLKRAPSAVPVALDRCIRTNGEPLDSGALEVHIEYSPFSRGNGPRRPTDEDDLLRHIISSGAQDHLLKHPVIESFLHAKWRRVRHLFYMNLVFYVVFTLLLTVYCTEEHHRLWVWVIVCLLTAVLATRELFQMLHDGKLYFASLENWLELALVTMATALLAGDGREGIIDSRRNIGAWQTHLKAWALLTAWYELTLMVAHFPTVGVYIYMVEGAAKKLALLLILFSPLAIGFAMGFHALFHDRVAFHSLSRSLLTTFLMAMGELDYDAFSSAADAWPWTAHILLALLVASLSIVTVNLLIGLSVADTAGMTQRAGVQRLRHTSLLLLHVQQALQSHTLQRLLPVPLLHTLRHHSAILPLLRVQPDTSLSEMPALNPLRSTFFGSEPNYQAAFRPNQPSERHVMFSVTGSGRLQRTRLQTRSSIQRNMLAMLRERGTEQERENGHQPMSGPHVTTIRRQRGEDELDFTSKSCGGISTSQSPTLHDYHRSKESIKAKSEPSTPRTPSKFTIYTNLSPTTTAHRSMDLLHYHHEKPRRKRSVCERDAAAALSQKLNTLLVMLADLRVRADSLQRKLDARVS